MSASRHPNRHRPGASFAFQPRNNITSSDEPEFPNYIVPSPAIANSTGLAHAFSGKRGNLVALRDISIMANERVPRKNEITGGQSISKKENTSDFDDDFDKLHRAFGSIKASALKEAEFSSVDGSKGLPALGHPAKVVSSRKQKADIFIHQTSRPEHHLGGTKISGPKGPAYQDRQPPLLPVFNSNGLAKTHSSYADEVFYTDPSKANEDLKALLEGGMEDEEEDEEERDTNHKGLVQLPSQQHQQEEQQQSQSDAVEKALAIQTKDDTSPPKSSTRKNRVVGADGIVKGLKVRLLPHQVEGVEWMRGRELGPVKRGKVPKGGLLADDMGLGKTLQSVSLILTNRKPEKDSLGWKKQFEAIEKTTLVVAPLALIRQWEHEIADKVEESYNLKVLVHHGPQRTKDFKKMARYDVVVTTYQILVSEFGNSSELDNGNKVGCFGLRWWRVILDEAHTIKNRNAKSTKACYALRSEYRWCLSGTPMQNNLDELQSLIKFLRIAPHDDLKQWREHIDTPMRNGQGHIAIRRLHSILRCFMKRRTKEILKVDGALNPGGKPDAEGELSVTGFRHTERKVVTISAKLPPAERKFYDRLEARADRNLEVMMQDKLSYASAFTLLLRLRQVCNHPRLVKGKLERDKDALSTGSSQKSRDTDLNAVVDMFADMGITTRSCSICGVELVLKDTTMQRGNCADCEADLECFESQEQLVEKAPTKKSRRKKTKKTEDKRVGKTARTGSQSASRTQRRPRNRKAVLDSDDEEEEEEEEEECGGSWLVSEEERGSLTLGEAGGEADENAEGGGDWIGSEDSEDDDNEKDESNLSSFVVDDETARQEKGYQSVDEADDNSLLSVDALTQAMAAQTLDDKKPMGKEGSAKSCGSTCRKDDDLSDPDATESGSYSSTDDEYDDSTVGGWLQSGRDSQFFASAKIREILRILGAEVKEHKFIVFSQFTSMLDLVEPFLGKDGFGYVRYDGSMKNEAREESLRRLREDKDTRILLCSLKCGSLGLNLTAATRVIIVEPFWNPFVEEQAIDRVHRLTQTVDVVVYKLIAADTVEERIVDLQNRKRELAEQTIEGGAKKESLKLGLNEIIDLFKTGGQHESGAPPGPLEDRRRLVGGGDRQGGVLRKKAGKEESAVYGRRW